MKTGQRRTGLDAAVKEKDGPPPAQCRPPPFPGQHEGGLFSPPITRLQKGIIHPIGAFLPGAGTEAACSQRLRSILSALQLEGL